jgi:AraC-like DNA-binding protein
LIWRLKTDQAVQLNRAPGLPLKEIAERCGAPDIYYFNRLFRARHGMPPGA